jgi:hypothetical protein
MITLANFCQPMAARFDSLDAVLLRSDCIGGFAVEKHARTDR